MSPVHDSSRRPRREPATGRLALREHVSATCWPRDDAQASAIGAPIDDDHAEAATPPLDEQRVVASQSQEDRVAHRGTVRDRRAQGLREAANGRR